MTKYDLVLSRCEKCGSDNMSAPAHEGGAGDGAEVLAARCQECKHETRRAFVPRDGHGRLEGGEGNPSERPPKKKPFFNFFEGQSNDLNVEDWFFEQLNWDATSDCLEILHDLERAGQSTWAQVQYGLNDRVEFLRQLDALRARIVLALPQDTVLYGGGLLEDAVARGVDASVLVRECVSDSDLDDLGHDEIFPEERAARAGAST